jgi:FtsZ-binding cell division protein ZapB
MGIIGDGIEVMKLVSMGANAELYGKLAKFVEEAQELNAKVEQLEESNKHLREQLKFKGTIVRISGNVYIDGDDEPIWSRCADVDHRPVHIAYHRDAKMGLMAMCPQCKSQSRRYVLRSKIESDNSRSSPFIRLY